MYVTSAGCHRVSTNCFFLPHIIISVILCEKLRTIVLIFKLMNHAFPVHDYHKDKCGLINKYTVSFSREGIFQVGIFTGCIIIRKQIARVLQMKFIKFPSRFPEDNKVKLKHISLHNASNQGFFTTGISSSIFLQLKFINTIYV